METPLILRERDRWLVVCKPAGWHTVGLDGEESGASTSAPTVEGWLRRERPELAPLPEAGIVHRLDRSTSGCLLVARDGDARRDLRAAISDPAGGIRKTYLAVVAEGIPSEGSFTLHFRGRHRSSAKVSVSERGEERERGRCRWKRLERAGAATPGSAMIEVELIGPGRRHQIRAGLAHLGFPLRGDALYRGDAPLPGLDGPALHAWRLEIDGEVVEAPLPPAWT